MVFPFGPGPSREPPSRRPLLYWVEDILILAAIVTLWPTVLRMSGTWVLAMQIPALIVMLVIMVARGRRLMAARRQAEEDARRL